MKAFLFNLKFSIFRVSFKIWDHFGCSCAELEPWGAQSGRAANIGPVNIQYTLTFVSGFKDSL